MEFCGGSLLDIWRSMSCNVSITLKLEKLSEIFLKSAVQDSCFIIGIYIELNSGKLKVLEYLQKTKTLKMTFFHGQSFAIGLK